MNSKIIFILLLYHFGAFYVKMEPILTLSQGILNGTFQQSRNGRIYSAFLGIPYAEPPIGNLRFTSPQAAKNWNGIRQANTFGNRCPQFQGMEVRGNEDCLFLNVYTPILKFNSKSENNEQSLLPVMVWIHGGAFVMGSSNNFRAQFLLDKDIILVTFNYRLGIFGFFTTGDSSSPGNYGLKDQVQALKWVQENIKSFGGDPQNVTIFGESAGGASVAFHAISEASNGLFHKYIIQSGTYLSPWAYQSKDELKPYIRGIGALLFCPLIFSERLVNCMRTKSVKSLMDTSSIFAIISWTPTDEPNIKGAFLTDNPANLMDQMKDLPFISGITADEGLVVSSFLRVNKYIPSVIRYIFEPVLSFVNNYYLNKNKNSNLTLNVNNFYFNERAMTESNEMFLENVTRFSTDAFFFYPQLKMLQTVTPKMKNSNYFYNFGYRGTFSFTNLTSGNNDNIGVSHTDELNYLFPISQDEYNMKSANYTKNDEFMIDVMTDLWTSFAINGKPTSKNLNPSDLWIPYDSENQTHLMIGDINNNTNPLITLSHSFYPNRMNFWKKHAPEWS